MKNNLEALTNYLFESIERVNDDDLTDKELEKEIKKSSQICKISENIISIADMQLKASKILAEHSSLSPKRLSVISGIIGEANNEN